MSCRMNILQKCTKLDANDLKEMLNFNQLHFLAMLVDKNGILDQTYSITEFN